MKETVDSIKFQPHEFLPNRSQVDEPAIGWKMCMEVLKNNINPEQAKRKMKATSLTGIVLAFVFLFSFGMGKGVCMIDIEQDPSSFSLKLKVPVAVDLLWKAWTQSHDLAQWLAPEANVKAEPNGAYELFWEPDHPERNSTIGCRVIEIRDKELLVINWKGPVPFADIMNVAPPPTAVKITFKSVGEQSSTVCLEHYGWGDGERWSQAQAWQLNAWKIAFQELEEYFQKKEKTMPIVGLARFETVAIYVEDFEKALKFYTEILGFEKIRNMGPGCLLELKGQLSLYLEGGRKPRIKKDIGTVPECVLCFSTTEGLKESWNRLRKAGVETFGDYEALSDDFHMFRIADPSGNLIEFAGKP